MTKDKAAKQAVRSRMAKTGERYAAARAHLTVTPAPPPPRVAEPGPSEDAVIRGTGRGWDEWLLLLDAWGAEEVSHGEIAGHVAETYHVSGWWAQSITVGYERARGMRAKHQNADGFRVSISKTMGAAPPRLAELVTQPAQQARWLEPGTVAPRTAVPDRSARFDVLTDASRILVTFDAKPGGRTTVTVTHERLPDREAVETWRGFWRERLARLAALVS